MRETQPSAQLLSRANALYNEIAATIPWCAGTWNEQTVDAIRDQLQEGALEEAFQRGLALTIDGAISLAIEELG